MSNAIKRRIRSAEKAIEAKAPLMITTFAEAVAVAQSSECCAGMKLSPELEQFFKNNTS